MIATGQYVVSLQAQPFHKKKRYYWIVCESHKPDKLVSWGHAPTQEQAETAAQNEAEDLRSGLSQGGRISSLVRPFTHRKR